MLLPERQAEVACHSLGSVGDSEESSNERDLTRDVALL